MRVFVFYIMFSSLAACLMAVIPQLTFLLAIAWGAALIVSSLYLERIKVLLIFIINIFLLYGIAGGSTVFFYLSFFGAAVLVMTILSTARSDYYRLQKWGLITAVIGVSLFMAMIYLNTGEIGMAEMEAQLGSYLENTIETYEESGVFDIYEERGISKTEVEGKFAEILSSIVWHLPAFYYLQAIMVVFFMLLLASFLSLKRNIQRLKKKPYAQEIMPWQLVWVVIAGLGLWLWGKDQANTIYYIGSNILLVMAPITVYFGLSALVYKLGHNKTSRSKIIIVLLIVLSFVFPFSALIFLSLIGLFDSLLDYRKLRLKGEDLLK